jgi:hypothetical protein
MRRGKIEETRFVQAVTEGAEGFEMLRADHSDRMSSMISGSEMAEPRGVLGKCIHSKSGLGSSGQACHGLQTPANGRRSRHAAGSLVIAHI